MSFFLSLALYLFLCRKHNIMKRIYLLPITCLFLAVTLSCHQGDPNLNDVNSSNEVNNTETTDTETTDTETTDTETTDTETNANPIVGTWERQVYDEYNNSDYRTITFLEDNTGIQKEVIPFSYDPCVYVSCPVYLATSTWHFGFTYDLDEENNLLNINYNHYFDYLSFGNSECYTCTSSENHIIDVSDAVVDLDAGTITYTDYAGTTTYVFTKMTD